MNAECLQARTEFSRAMSEKDEDHLRRELALQEQHSRDLAKKSQASVEEMMMARPGEREGREPQGDDGKDGGAPGARERRSSKARRHN